MLQKLPQSSGNVFSYAVEGKLAQEEYAGINSDIEAVIAEHGRVRLLVDMADMEGFKLNAMDDDLRMARYLSKIDRMAIVGDKRIYNWMISAADLVTKYPYRHFSTEERELAWEWIQGSDE